MHAPLHVLLACAAVKMSSLNASVTQHVHHCNFNAMYFTRMRGH